VSFLLITWAREVSCLALMVSASYTEAYSVS
jgi:hypothetical protein